MCVWCMLYYAFLSMGIFLSRFGNGVYGYMHVCVVMHAAVTTQVNRAGQINVLSLSELCKS